MSTTEKRRNAPIHHERQMRIICVGAGASGLLFAYKLQRSFNNFSLVVYEKNPALSGTWFENRYPGCACDVPSHNYTWSFEPKLDWSGVYATSQEIYTYFNDFAAKYALGQYCKTEHEVCGARWDESRAKWDVQIKDLRAGTIVEDSCDILINAGGILNAWRWPAIPGLKDYTGTLLHTANWDESVELTGKHVGLIGNGSSGIQVLPAIQPIVSKLTTFIREPTWIAPPTGQGQHIFSDEERHDFATKPNVLTQMRKDTETGMNSVFSVFLKDTQMQHDLRNSMTATMREKIHDAELEAKLIPQWGVGCRRLTPGVNYLETLHAENVKVVYGEINKITPNGCLCDDGNEYPVDVLICATGFDTSFKPRFPIYGFGGKNLQDEWAQEPKSYLGLAAAGMPNYLIFLGPNCPIGNGPVLSAIETQADHMLAMIDRWQTENIHSFSPKAEAIEDFCQYTDEFMKRTIWNEECRSWYKNNSATARISALWPGSTLHYIEALQEPRLQDWEVRYSGNRFAFLGNGYSQTELDPTADLGYYIREQDDGQFSSKSKKRQVLTKSGSKKSGGVAVWGQENVVAADAAPAPRL
ncbi:hypothetical protein BP6252_09630 [Coleophoma cylindrospora]|uniref:Uncharacterized protein n=1 Tax=Coleophoma cylindrospora TaxID=1849047 RepID=A0A3D8QW46_9HELO|nr:hypothetical protein BP6252_09630 [Coleophoma cylindrospora]